MMRFLAAIILAISLMMPASASAPAYRITFDMGGRIMDYVKLYNALRDSGGHVVIDGECVSACTLVTMLPPSQVCITRRATLGFHTAFDLNPDGSEPFDLDATTILWQEYPPELRTILANRGLDGTKAHPHLVWLGYRDLLPFFPSCQHPAMGW